MKANNLSKDMTIKTTKIKNGVIVLPKKIRQNWQEADVWLQVSKDSIYVKRLSRPSLSEMLKEFRKIGKTITKKDVDEAIKWARKKTAK